MGEYNTDNGRPDGYYFFVPVRKLETCAVWKKLSSNDKLVFGIGICSFGGKDGSRLSDKPIPVQWIANRAGCTRRAAINSIARLKSIGILKSTDRIRSAQTYRIDLNWCKPCTSENCSLVKAVHLPSENRSPVVVKTVHSSIKQTKQNEIHADQKSAPASKPPPVKSSAPNAGTLIAKWAESMKNAGGDTQVTGQAAGKAASLWKYALSLNGADPEKALSWCETVLSVVFARTVWPFSEGLGNCTLVSIRGHLQKALDELPKVPRSPPPDVVDDPQKFAAWKRRNYS